MATSFFARVLRLFRKPPGDINCQQVLDQLYEYVDGELDDPQLLEAIREHLRVCKRCFPRYEFEKAFLRLLAERGGGEAPQGFRRRIFERLLEQESGS